jgi:hypothetical protein
MFPMETIEVDVIKFRNDRGLSYNCLCLQGRHLQQMEQITNLSISSFYKRVLFRDIICFFVEHVLELIKYEKLKLVITK